MRGAAIRPIPGYAVVERFVLDAIERELAAGAAEAEDDDAPSERAEGRLEHGLESHFQRFEDTQPALSERALGVLSRPLDETALALGYFLTIAVWLAFDRAFGPRLGAVTDEALAAAEEALTLEEALRAERGEEPLDLDEVMAIEQPGLLAFVNEHVDAALDGESEEREVDVDDVHAVYRSVLLVILALSHAVAPAAASVSHEAQA